MSGRPDVPSREEFNKLVKRVEDLENSPKPTSVYKVLAAGEFAVKTNTSNPVDIPLRDVRPEPGCTVGAVVTGRNNVPRERPFNVHLMIVSTEYLRVWFEPPPGPYDNGSMGGIQYVVVQMPT